jgi:DNA-directed RNA polymerase subunit RPC12/RpoP
VKGNVVMVRVVYKCQKCGCIFSVENFHSKKQIEYAVCAQCGNGRLTEEDENESWDRDMKRKRRNYYE